MEKNIIFVKNFITYCLIGVYPEEKKNKQKIKVSVKLNIKRRAPYGALLFFGWREKAIAYATTSSMSFFLL